MSFCTVDDVYLSTSVPTDGRDQLVFHFFFTVCVLGIGDGGDGMLPSSGLFASVDGGAIVLILVNSSSCDRAG